ncbi:stage III sporulation protein AF [Lentibacillus cibarius]|uniref:stage III sporulation protein AF n=1 Tax=Lentibacillus cibarius TaxID=2583219 RepID=UPI001F43AE99|nr:stage III sporulation protein AF [Lentibacillus cibarius]
MDILVEWVTQIILFLLLASVVDLLIPANSMKKYIKLTVGLILILIFLKPVFYLFDMDVQQAVKTSYTEMMDEQTKKNSLENATKMKKNELQASQNAYIVQQTAVQLKELGNKPLKKNYQQKITDIDLQFSKEVNPADENLKKKLTQIIVHLQEMQTEEVEGGMAVVEDVVIDTDKPVSDENEVDTEGIKNLLQNVWEVDKNKITIARGEGHLEKILAKVVWIVRGHGQTFQKSRIYPCYWFNGTAAANFGERILFHSERRSVYKQGSAGKDEGADSG